MEEHPCIPCQYGDHAEHIDYPEAPGPGVMGGWHCPCKGECEERNVRNLILQAESLSKAPEEDGDA